MEMGYSIAEERRDKELLDMPLTWEQNESAGEDWYYGFILRHSGQLSLRKPEAPWKTLWGMIMYLRGKISV